MNNVIDADETDKAQSLRTVGYISYLLHTIVAVGALLPGAQAGALLLVVAFVIDMVKRDDARDTWQASHFSWRIRTVLWAGFWYLLTFPLFLLLYVPGAVAWTIISVWFLYRIVRGWSALSGGRAMPH